MSTVKEIDSGKEMDEEVDLLHERNREEYDMDLSLPKSSDLEYTQPLNSNGDKERSFSGTRRSVSEGTDTIDMRVFSEIIRGQTRSSIQSYLKNEYKLQQETAVPLVSRKEAREEVINILSDEDVIKNESVIPHIVANEVESAERSAEIRASETVKEILGDTENIEKETSIDEYMGGKYSLHEHTIPDISNKIDYVERIIFDELIRSGIVALIIFGLGAAITLVTVGETWSYLAAGAMALLTVISITAYSRLTDNE